MSSVAVTAHWLKQEILGPGMLRGTQTVSSLRGEETGSVDTTVAECSGQSAGEERTRDKQKVPLSIKTEYFSAHACEETTYGWEGWCSVLTQGQVHRLSSPASLEKLVIPTTLGRVRIRRDLPP